MAASQQKTCLRCVDHKHKHGYPRVIRLPLGTPLYDTPAVVGMTGQTGTVDAFESDSILG